MFTIQEIELLAKTLTWTNEKLEVTENRVSDAMRLKKCNIKINTEGGGSWIVLFCHPLLFLMEYFIQCLRYYLFTPLTSLFIGFAIALTGDFNLKEKFVFYIPYQLYFEEKIPVHLNYEHV